MKKEIQESINFLLNEYRRLQQKKKEDKLSEEEKDLLEKLVSFLGKNKE